MSETCYEGYVRIEQRTDVGMITLRADLSDKKVHMALKKVLALEVPAAGMSHSAAQNTAAWMSPDELLILTSTAQVTDICGALIKGFAKLNALVVNVSDARSVFAIHGTQLREVLAKLTPIDTAVAALPVAAFRRSRFGQVPGAIYMREETQAQFFCFRSVGDYAFDLLCDAAKPKAAVFAD